MALLCFLRGREGERERGREGQRERGNPKRGTGAERERERSGVHPKQGSISPNVGLELRQ